MTEQANEQQASSSSVPLLFVGFGVVGMVMAAVVLLASPGNTGNTAPIITREARVQSGQNTIVGWEVPDFTLDTLAGEPVSLSDYRGKIVFINFWATWCVPCQREMPAFEDFMASDQDDAVILAVNNGESIGDVQGFVDLFGLEALPILMDEDFAVSDGFGVVNLPVTYVLDPDGVVHNFKLGEMTERDIELYIEQIQS